MNNQRIILIAQGNFESEFLEMVAREVSHEYLTPVGIEESHLDLGAFYDPMRRQYDANDLLREIDTSFAEGAFRKIGLFRVDLFIPILTYIFGQAAFKGNTGIASIYRLRNEQYGMEKDEDLLIERFTKVVIHELGHTYGLIHCHNPSCVMRSSTYVEDIDQKSMHLCSKCRETVNLSFL